MSESEQTTAFREKLNDLSRQKTGIETEINNLMWNAEKVVRIELFANGKLSIQKLNGGFILFDYDSTSIEIIDHNFQHHKRNRRKAS